MRKTRLTLWSQYTRRLRGRVNYYYDTKRQVLVARKWPRKRSGGTPAQIAAREKFKTVVGFMKLKPAEFQAFASKLVVGTDYLWRDLLMSAAYGRLVQVNMRDGTTYRSLVIAQMTIQQLLDSLSPTPGAMLVRTATAWMALLGGTENQVLQINDETGLPDWQTLSIPDPDAQSILNELGSTPGDMIVHTEDGWDIIAAGDDEFVLTIDTGTGRPLWKKAQGGDLATYTTPGIVQPDGTTITVTSGGLLSSVPSLKPGVPPVIVQSAIDTSSGGTVTLPAAPTSGNLLVAMFSDPSSNSVSSGWTSRASDNSGTDYNVVCTKIAGASESATQKPINASPTSQLIAIWEISGQAAAYLVSATVSTNIASTNLFSTPFPALPDIINLMAVAAENSTETITATYNMTVDYIANTGTRRGAMGHSDGSAALAQIIAIKSGTLGGKAMTCQITA